MRCSCDKPQDGYLSQAGKQDASRNVVIVLVLEEDRELLMWTSTLAVGIVLHFIVTVSIKNSNRV